MLRAQPWVWYVHGSPRPVVCISYKLAKHSDGSEVAVVRGPRLVEVVKDGVIIVMLPSCTVVVILAVLAGRQTSSAVWI